MTGDRSNCSKDVISFSLEASTVERFSLLVVPCKTDDARFTIVNPQRLECNWTTMDSAERSWPEAAAAWVVEGNQERLPPTLTDAIAGASGAEIDQLLQEISTVVYQIDPPSQTEDGPSSSPTAPVCAHSATDRRANIAFAT